MPGLLHTFILILAVGAAYWWVSVPELSMYSLQAIAWVTLLYFLLKRVSKAKYWHVLPTTLSIETALATFGFLILIGSTGNTSSLLFPLIYVYLFLVVFSSSVATSITITLAVMLFHYALTPTVGNSLLANLITLPLVLILFLFAKRQHEELIRNRVIIANDTTELETLESGDTQVVSSVSTIQTKLDSVNHQLSFPLTDTSTVQAQVTGIQLEMAKLNDYLKKRWFLFTQPNQTPPNSYDRSTH